MQSFPDRPNWQKHLSSCGRQYMKTFGVQKTLPCPLACPGHFASEKLLWHHLSDAHNTPEPKSRGKRKRTACTNDTSNESRPTKSTKRARCTETRDTNFVHTSFGDSGMQLANLSHLNGDTYSAVHMASSGTESPSLSENPPFREDTVRPEPLESEIPRNLASFGGRNEYNSSPGGEADPVPSRFTPAPDIDPALRGDMSLFDAASRFSSGTTSPIFSTRCSAVDPEEAVPAVLAESSPTDGVDTQSLVMGALGSSYSRDIFPSGPTHTPLSLSPASTDDLPITKTVTVSAPEDEPPSPLTTTDNDNPVLSARISLDMIDLALRSDAGASEPKKDVLEDRRAGMPCLDVPCLATETVELSSTVEDELYLVECLLDKWKNAYYVRWGDRSCSWQPRTNIADRSLIAQLNETHRGLGPGVEVLDTRRKKRGKLEYLVHFVGCKERENTWVAERHLSPRLVEEYRKWKAEGSTGRFCLSN